VGRLTCRWSPQVARRSRFQKSKRASRKWLAALLTRWAPVSSADAGAWISAGKDSMVMLHITASMMATGIRPSGPSPHGFGGGYTTSGITVTKNFVV
jgi:hypothetical protein